MTPASDVLTICEHGRNFINFSSNDYLGLSYNSNVIGQASEYVEKFGAGAAASRLITGTFTIHNKLEKDLSAALNRIPSMEKERQQFHQRITDFRKQLQELGFNTGPSSTQIIPEASEK